MSRTDAVHWDEFECVQDAGSLNQWLITDSEKINRYCYLKPRSGDIELLFKLIQNQQQPILYYFRLPLGYILPAEWDESIKAALPKLHIINAASALRLERGLGKSGEFIPFTFTLEDAKTCLSKQGVLLEASVPAKTEKSKMYRFGFFKRNKITENECEQERLHHHLKK